jgi:hydroxyacylglutathione hydrolase
LHADFISGHLDLAKRTGAKIYIAKSAECTFGHVPLEEDDEISIENIHLQVLETPGHTPEHLSFVVTDKNRGDSPIGVFSGDTLFVGDVGRPDLFPDKAQFLADKLYHSLHDKLMKLPDYCEVYPAHGAGSLCGRSMGAKYQSTIGYERKFNPVLQIPDKKDFIKSLTEDMPSAPDHFSRCSEINRNGPELIENLPELRRLTINDFAQMIKDPDIQILDTRNYLAFGGQHIQESWHLDLNGNFPTFAGWVLPTDKDFVLITDDADKAHESVVWARRVGVDRIIGYLVGGMPAWLTSGSLTSSVTQLSTEELHDMVVGENDFTLVDVRAKAEFEETHIGGAINIETADLRKDYDQLNKEETVILVCSTGNRSSLGTSILAQRGFDKLYNTAGGMTGYSAAGYSKECNVCSNPHGSRFFNEVYENKNY